MVRHGRVAVPSSWTKEVPVIQTGPRRAARLALLALTWATLPLAGGSAIVNGIG